MPFTWTGEGCLGLPSHPSPPADPTPFKGPEGKVQPRQVLQPCCSQANAGLTKPSLAQQASWGSLLIHQSKKNSKA